MTNDILNSTLNARNNRDAYMRQIFGSIANRVFRRGENAASFRA